MTTAKPSRLLVVLAFTAVYVIWGSTYFAIAITIGPGGFPPFLMAGAIAGTAFLGGCITVKAPDKPIVIELNINIKQEVIYRLADDVRSNIDENPEIF